MSNNNPWTSASKGGQNWPRIKSNKRSGWFPGPKQIPRAGWCVGYRTCLGFREVVCLNTDEPPKSCVVGAVKEVSPFLASSTPNLMIGAHNCPPRPHHAVAWSGRKGQIFVANGQRADASALLFCPTHFTCRFQRLPHSTRYHLPNLVSWGWDLPSGAIPILELNSLSRFSKTRIRMSGGSD